jgi:hypothetical protein
MLVVGHADDILKELVWVSNTAVLLFLSHLICICIASPRLLANISRTPSSSSLTPFSHSPTLPPTMSASTPTPQDAGLPAPALYPAKLLRKQSVSDSRPTILHLGDNIRWNHELYAELQKKFNLVRSYSMGRDEFKQALREKRWGDFVGMYRPFWNTGGEMGNWDEELMYHHPFYYPSQAFSP